MASVNEIAASPLYHVPELRATMEQLVPIRMPHRRNIARTYKRSLLITLASSVPAILVGVFVTFDIAMIVFYALLAIAGLWWVMRVRYRETNAEVRTLYLRAVTRATLCPTCLYDLCGAETDGDGTAICPECGSCWDSARFERTVTVHIPDNASDFDAFRRDRPSNQLMMMKSIRDESGQWFVLMNPRSKRLRSSIGDPGRIERLKRATRRSEKQGAFVRIALSVILMIYLLVMFFSGGGVTAAAWSKLGPLPQLIAVLWSLFVLRVIWSLLLGRLGVKPDRIVRDALDEDLCPACWADLAGVEIEPDTGVIACPSCGARWSVLARERQREIASGLPDPV